MNALAKFGLVAIYILVFPSLARTALVAPRIVGLSDYVSDLFIVVVGSVIGYFGLKAAAEHWKERGLKGSNGMLLADSRKRIRKWLFIVITVAAVLTLVVVVIDRAPSLNAYTPYWLMLVLVTIAGSVAAVSTEEASSLAPRKAGGGKVGKWFASIGNWYKFIWKPKADPPAPKPADHPRGSGKKNKGDS